MMWGAVYSIRKEMVYVQAAEPVIRVLLTTSDFASKYHETVTVAYNNKEITYQAKELQKAGYTVRIPAQKEGIRVLSVKRQCGTPVYQGSLELIPREEGILLVNELVLEKYLEGVVPSEMPPSYETEALKAQAVCARTYAWKQIQEQRLKDFDADVDDSVGFQVYGNVESQSSTDEAVRETEGQILCQNGEPIEAYYFSTSAGITSTDEIWGAKNASGYLKSVVCGFDSEEPWSRWQVELPWNLIEKRTSERLGKETELKAVAVSSKNESGAVTGLEVTAEAGVIEVKTEYDVRKFLSPSGYEITEKDGTKCSGGELLPSAYFQMKVIVGNKICITGSGYGHGVGMSQNAANRMAEQNYQYDEILDYFFKNVTLENLG